MSVHLHAVSDGPVQPVTVLEVEPVFFVIQRQNGHWSPAAKIISVHDNEIAAEFAASTLKESHPQQNFGVAALRSEARVVPKPIEIVRVPS